MTREIKFRVFSKIQDKNVYCKWDHFFDRKSSENFEENDLMQYTGLKDKNDKEIYEGDIMYVQGVGNRPVIFRNGAFGFDNEPFMEYMCEDMETNIVWEILGNIHENSELLK